MAKSHPAPAAAPAGPAEPAGLIEWRETDGLLPHAQAVLLPKIEAEQYRALRADIERRGLLVPLEVTAAGVVLDGHVRLRAAGELGHGRVPVRVVATADEVEYLLLAALQRRQLSASQRAALVLELDQYQQAQEEANRRRLANLKGRPAVVAALPPRGRTRERAAAWADVSARTIQDAATVKAADPALFAQVKQGRLPAHRAARQVRQRLRDAQLTPAAPLPEGPFELLYADPPWRLPGSPDSSRAVENHYPTMPPPKLAAMRVPAAEDALLLLWAVNSLLPQALQVLAAWGFSYLSNFVWVKDKIGLGHYNRCQHELLLVGRRGSFPPPATDRRLSSVIEQPRGRHSEKPEQLYELIEQMYPRASKLELFARGPARPGWTTWGNQAEPQHLMR